MNNIQISKIMKNELRPVFRGVFPIDKLHKIGRKLPSAIIINTDKSTGRGKHWCGIYIQKDGKAIYFDSFGRKPEQYEVLEFLNNRCKSWYYNQIMLQNPLTAVCGGYCIWFLTYYHKRKDIGGFFKQFSTNLLKNDYKVVNFIKHKFRVRVFLFPSIRFMLNK